MIKLMIVDDSNIIRNRIARSLDQTQYDLVAVASNGKEALEALQKHQPDAVTMDITMPQMDGLECIKKMIEIKPDVNILVVSALSDRKTGIRALKLGARGFICKPFTDEQLLADLNEMIRDARSRGHTF